MGSVTAIYEETLGHLLGPVQPYLQDPTVSEVMVNGYEEVYVERRGRLERTDARFPDADALEAAMRNIAQFVGKRLDRENPSIEARLPDGSRVNAIISPLTLDGPCLTIRKLSEDHHRVFLKQQDLS